MSTKRLLTDETGLNVITELQKQNALLSVIASNNGGLKPTSWADIHAIVQNGMASDVFSIGDQFEVTWKDVADNNKEYTVPLDVVHFADVELADGSIVPGMYLQWHYAMPFSMPFDAQEAFYVANTALSAGTYNITVGTDWGTNCHNGDTFQFTLTQAVPAGGMLVGFLAMPDKTTSEWQVSSYASGASTTAIETVTVTAGSAGTSLGTFTVAGSTTVNSIHRLAYGYNRWSQSALRQYLNSNDAVGQWWTSKNSFDRVPTECATKAGFLSGFDEEFLNCIKPIKVTTALNTVTDDGTLENTYDKFFIPSLEQMYITPQIAGEGESWEYWKQASGLTTKMAQYGTYPQITTYALENNTSSEYVRLRSAGRSNGNTAWNVKGSGNISCYYAISTYSCAPVCVIC